MDDFGNALSTLATDNTVRAMVRFYFIEKDGIFDESTLAFYGMV